jgi:hypothetical protein
MPRACIMFAHADGTEGNHATIEGDEARIRVALHGCLGVNNAARAWATDARTGELIAGVYYDGRALTSLPTTQYAVWIGAFKGEMRGGVWDAHGGGRLVRPPLARIIERDASHVYRAVRGGGNRMVLVYINGRCIGHADPIDLGFTGTDAMIAAGAAS